MDKENNKLVVVVFLFLIFYFLSGCNEKPTEITYNLLYDTTSVIPLSSDTVNFFRGGESKYVFAKIFNVGAVFIGAYNGYRAGAMFRFKETNLPDTLAAWLTVDRIDSVRIVLPFARYVLGDSVNPNFSFKIYLIKEYWSNQVTWDSLFNDWYPNSKVEQVPIGSFSGKIELKDTMPEISVSLQKDFIIDWLQKSKDTIPIWGILLAPEPNCNIIHQINAQYIAEKEPPHPKIIVNYRHKDGSYRIWYIHSAIDASVVMVPPVDTTKLIIQSGYSYRFKINFDVSHLPLFSAIHYAELELTIDKENTLFGNNGLDTVFTGGYFADAPLDSVPIVSFYGRRQGDKVYFQKVSTPIELWLKNSRKGELYFYSYYWNEVRSLNRIAFYGFDASDPTKRPKLKIIYSKRFAR